ncbi:VWA domain-containing protein [Thiohalocapsa halophila]|uniref:VWA domain-containing protein n=1 Tax=Thiohalocapsa halophila TaxID=69359 RepID=A0ABS1CFG5_9GAMM|nr:VWA domain-containing protein [Thiohalocapsa halophila]MBK1630650.1 VWA domain-containing protein [Thiohalocapsa halophila]
MSLTTITNALPIVAAAYGRKFNVPVQVGGNDAYTNGKTIQIPQIDDTPTSRIMAYGYLAHEAAHVRFTDFDLARSHTPLGRFVEGVLEDVRIETAIIRTYPGTRRTLDAVIDHLVDTGSMNPVSTTNSPSDIFGNGLLAISRHRYRQQPALRNHADQADGALRQVFGDSFVRRLHGLLADVPRLTSTADSMALAQRILELMEDEAQQPQDQQENSSKEQRTQPNDQGSGSEGTGHQSSESQAQGSESNAPGAQDEDSGTDAEEQSAASQAPSTDAEAHSALNQALSATDEDLPTDLFEQVAETLQANAQPSPTLLPTVEHFAGDPVQGQQTLKRVKVHSAKLTSRLQGLVQAHTMARSRTVRHGRQLSPSHLHRAAVGDPRIFRTKEQREAPNTALHLLVDLSGSMAGGKDRLALDAAMALALALEPMGGVSRAVTAFPGIYGQEDQVAAVVGHGQPVSRHAGAFTQGARGGTPMTGALWFAAADLLARSEERRVLITLTDGVPNHFVSAVDLVQRAGSSGIELIGIGIQTEISALFPTAIRIDDIADLKRELFRIAERLLLSTHR